MRQRGFTLLELMVAMVIFAMLAVAGWQVFDGVTRARDKAQHHANHLAALQYAYLQLQQDMGQIVAYAKPSSQTLTAANDDANDNNTSIIAADPFMSLDGEQVSFVRFADPDPRYQISASLQRITYIFADERLIRRQYSDIHGGNESVSLDTVLLEGVTLGRWQAYLPEVSVKFPSNNGQNSASNPLNTNNSSADNALPDILLLPKGVGVDFTYQDMSLTWQWALAPQALPQHHKKTVTQSNNDNSTDDNSNTNNTNDGSSNNNANLNNTLKTVE